MKNDLTHINNTVLQQTNMSSFNYGYFNEDDAVDDYSFSTKKEHTHTMCRLEEYTVVGDDGREKISKQVASFKVYASGFMGGFIRHAVTGECIGRVGKDDREFFKVSVTGGIKPGLSSNPVHLFYYSRDEYERHHRI